MNINEWNNKVLKQQGVKAVAKSPGVVRSVGDAKRATLPTGEVVHRVDHLWVDGYGIVKCMNTELHFIFEAPKQQLGWGLYCTCGSIAGVVGWAAYSKLASPSSTGFVIACVRYLTTKNNVGIGEHADGSHE